MSLELSGTTGLKGVAGSVAAPSIVGDDTNTGISFPAADTIKFSTGGVERMSITNSGITGVVPITYVDSWRVNTTFTAASGSNDVTSNWERDDTNFEVIGTGLSHNGSGVFGFQETGKFLIRNRFVAYQSSGRRYIGVQTMLSTGGVSGSYSTIVETYDSVHNTGGSHAFAAGGGQKIIDATSTDFYFKFRTVVVGDTIFDCHTSQNRFCFDVIKLGTT